jgi:hypothetical protein
MNCLWGLITIKGTGATNVGLFKQMKDMKDLVNAAPGMVEQAQRMGAQAQEMAAAQRAAMQAQTAQAAQAGGAAAGGAAAGAEPAGPDFAPIDEVSIEQFAAVSKGVAAFNYDQSKLVEIAASKGIPGYAWEAAFQGWNERIKRNPAVAQRFNQLYRAS